MTAKGRAPSREILPGVAADRDALGYCPYFQHTVELLGRRWTGSIVRVLMLGPRRFGEIRAAIPGLSDRLLSERLHELEAEGWVHHEILDDSPTYQLTEQGRGLEPVLDQIGDFADRWAKGGCSFDVPGRIQP